MFLLKDIFANEKNFIDKEVEVAGWIKNSRFNNNIGFIELNDGTTFRSIQIVVESKLDNFQTISKLLLPSAIIVKGKVVKSLGGKQNFEINASEIVVEGESTDKYPLQKKRHTFEFLRTIQHLRPRANTFNAVFRVRSILSYALHKFFFERGFVYAHTPIITASDAEGAGEMFTVSTLDFNVSLDDTDFKNLQMIKNTFNSNKFLIINFEDFNLDMNIEHFKELILYLISNKEVIKLDSGYMLRENYDLAVNIIKDFIIKNGSISVSDARDLLNSNRKSTMELLEFLDKEKITLRKDNERILVK